MASEKSVVRTARDTIFTFFALYLATLFSLDSWDSARASPYRAPGANTYFRPASTPPAPGSYQAGMHGRGNAGPDSSNDTGRRGVATIPTARDSRPPVRMGGTASCGACMT